ncbi:MAG: hypothetical protein ISS52_00455 [Dehalococcoidia bacterium]|nr:hypothetical protein [Dehalococcoidia bacterium]
MSDICLICPVGAAKDNRYAMLLVAMAGVGYCSGLLIESESVDVKRSPSAKQLYSYARLLP